MQQLSHDFGGLFSRRPYLEPGALDHFLYRYEFQHILNFYLGG